jgi:urease accessory protein
MAYAGFLGLIGVTLPGAEIGIALSGVCLGVCVLAESRPPLWIACLLVGAFGLFHGYAHGVELQPGTDALFYSIGFVVATGLLHATGIAIGVLHRWQWGRQALRGAGMLILCGGLYFTWTALK